MKTFLYCVLSVLVVALSFMLNDGWLFAQAAPAVTPEQPQSNTDPDNERPKSTIAKLRERRVQTVMKQRQDLIEEYVQLAQTKADIMSLDELKDAVAATRREVSEMESEKELERDLKEVIRSLNQFISEHPGSNAAKRAKKVIHQIQDKSEPDFF